MDRGARSMPMTIVANRMSHDTVVKTAFKLTLNLDNGDTYILGSGFSGTL